MAVQLSIFEKSQIFFPPVPKTWNDSGDSALFALGLFFSNLPQQMFVNLWPKLILEAKQEKVWLIVWWELSKESQSWLEDWKGKIKVG